MIHGASRLSMSEVVLGVRAGLKDKYLETRIRIRQPTGDEAGSRATYRLQGGYNQSLRREDSSPPAKITSYSASTVMTSRSNW